MKKASSVIAFLIVFGAVYLLNYIADSFHLDKVDALHLFYSTLFGTIFAYGLIYLRGKYKNRKAGKLDK